MSTSTKSLIEESGEPILASEKAWYTNVCDFYPGLAFIIEPKTKGLFHINGHVSACLDFTREDVAQWNSKIDNLVNKEDLSLFYDELQLCYDLKESELRNFQIRLNHKNETRVPFRMQGKCIPVGRSKMVILMGQDIREELRIDNEARETRSLLKNTENILQFATWYWNAATKEIRWSPGVHILLNHPNDKTEWSGESFMDYVISEDRDRIVDLYHNAVRNKAEFTGYEYSIRTRDNKTKVIRTDIKFNYIDGKCIGAFGINRDITEKSRLLNNLIRYREMIMEKESFLGQGTWEKDLQTGTMFWSDGMYALFGYSVEMDKRNLNINDTIYRLHMSEEDYEKDVGLQKSTIENDNSYLWQYSIITLSGDSKQLETFGKIIRDTDGKAVKIIGTTRDVTQLHQYERELELKIEELNRSNKDLEEFAYVASHDMHEPLRKVHSFADRLKAKYGHLLEEEGVSYVNRILASTQNARLMIDGLMEFSKLSRSGFWFEKSSLSEIVSEVVTDLELKIDETKAIIEVIKLPELEVIRIQMKQLFSNIILNSLKFKSPDTVPIIEIRSRKLTRQEILLANLDKGAEYYKLTVKDNGIGFEPEYADKIFQMFQRLNSKSEYPGSGIGLALCKKIVENHRGQISAISSPGIGTTIAVILPVKFK